MVVKTPFDVMILRCSFDFGGARAAGLLPSMAHGGDGYDSLSGSGSNTPESSRPTSLDYGPGAPPPSVRGYALGSDMGSNLGAGSDLGSDMGSRPVSSDYGPRAPPPSVRGYALGSDMGSELGAGSDLGSELGSRPTSLDYGPRCAPARLAPGQSLSCSLVLPSRTSAQRSSRRACMWFPAVLLEMHVCCVLCFVLQVQNLVVWLWSVGWC